MRIYHYQRPDGVANFGDALNLWLWQKLIPETIAYTDDSVLVGLGTVLNNRLPERMGPVGSAAIFSSGAGYERPLRAVPDRWRVYCVRGPLTAQQLSLSPPLAVTDGGMLLPRVVSSLATPPSYLAAFMPHVHHATFAGDLWAEICQTVGFCYIDPRSPVEQVIAAIQDSRLLIAEAMHGAIAADALGIPWIPVITSHRVLTFKWRDWCASIRQPYQPVSLPPLVPPYPRHGRGLRSCLQVSDHWLRVLIQGHGLLNPLNPEQAANRLVKIAAQSRPMLSDRTHLENLIQALEERLSQLRKDVRDSTTDYQ